MSPPRVGVYNRYWASHGGGERHSGMLAQVLAGEGADVDLIGHTDVDLDRLGAYLGLDLSACRLRVVPDAGEVALSVLSADYDLFVNASYMSRVRSQARKSVYLCYFPTPSDHDLAGWRRALIRGFVRVVHQHRDQLMSPTWGLGWFPPEGGLRRSWAWTSGDGVLIFPAGGPLHLRFDVARVAAAPTRLTVTVDGAQAVQVEVGPRFTSAQVQIGASSAPRTLHFSSDTFVPGPTDGRTLGVAVSRLRQTDSLIHPWRSLALRFPWLLRDPRDVGFVDSYDVVLANSQFTAEWIANLWQHTAEVVYPPIEVDRFTPVAARRPSIVSVGRFFAPGQGHSKRQLEQVQAFARLVRSGRLPGWRLHLIGGCEPAQQRYLDQVRSAAAGLPVDFDVNAPRALLEQALSSAAIQWSATGYREHSARAPWASEHFGMTTVEAMAGGCVPVVIDKAGQREIVRDGVDGFRWTTLAELTDRTVQVAADETLRARLSASAIDRAQAFSDASFAAQIRDVVARHGLL